MPKYMWKKKNWTEFSWNSAEIILLLSNARKAQGQIIAQAGRLELSDYSELITSEAISTSEIEGEKVDVKSVRSSVARRLGLSTAGLPAPSSQSEGLIDLLMDATEDYRQKLTKKRLCGWQAALFPTGYSGIYKIDVGKFRKGSEPMRVVSGRPGEEKIHYEAPPSEDVPGEMKLFFKWWNSRVEIDGIIRAAIAHLWFVTIHPFDDGNGRVGRAITDMALAQDEQTGKRLYSLSTQIMRERKKYYEILERTQKNDGDITEWLKWFLNMFVNSIENSKELIKKSLFVDKFYRYFSGVNLNERQTKVIKKLIEHYPKEFVGGLTNRKYVSMTKTSPETAKRDLKDLFLKGLLVKNDGKGRSTSYRLNSDC